LGYGHYSPVNAILGRAGRLIGEELGIEFRLFRSQPFYMSAIVREIAPTHAADEWRFEAYPAFVEAVNIVWPEDRYDDNRVV
jgi:hypothetical protein